MDEALAIVIQLYHLNVWHQIRKIEVALKYEILELTLTNLHCKAVIIGLYYR